MTQHDIPIGFYPFWFWNDDLSADEIRWQVGAMAAQGVRGFFIHSRQGLERPVRHIRKVGFTGMLFAVHSGPRYFLGT